MTEIKRELRMYFLVMYNIRPIQQGIQSLHGSKAYVKKYKGIKKIIELHDEWDEKFETVIILNGGTSNNGLVDTNNWKFPAYGADQKTFYFDETKLGTMELHEKFLIENNIPYASFHEPDLNNSLSSLCFICDEKVFNFENYPTFEKLMIIDMSEIDTTNPIFKYLIEIDPLDTEEEMRKKYEIFVGGEQNVKLKELIYGKELAK